MPYNLRLIQKPAYLHAVVTGENTSENVMGYLKELRRECTARSCFRVLIEERLDGPRLRQMEVYQIVSDTSARTRGRFKAIAFVDLNADGGEMEFAETVAVNRGVPVRVFATVAEAAQWLLAGSQAEA